MTAPEVVAQLLEFWEERDMIPTVREQPDPGDSVKLHGAERVSGILFALCSGRGREGPLRVARVRDLPIPPCRVCMKEYRYRLLAGRQRPTST